MDSYLKTVVRFQWKNPDFLLKNPDFRLKNVDFIIKQGRNANLLLNISPNTNGTIDDVDMLARFFIEIC